MSDIRFDREDVTLEPLPPETCTECDEDIANYYIQIDLRAAGMSVSLGEGRYCQKCGEEELEAIRASLPERLNEDGTYPSVGEADVGGA